MELVNPTGNDLLAACRDGSSVERMQCDYFVSGVVNSLKDSQDKALEFALMMQGQVPLPKPTLCIPSGVTLAQIVDVVIEQLEKHPAGRHYPAARLAIVAVETAFPCKEK